LRWDDNFQKTIPPTQSFPYRGSFEVTLLPFYGFQTQGSREEIIMASRAKYAGKRKEIERKIQNKRR